METNTIHWQETGCAVGIIDFNSYRNWETEAGRQKNLFKSIKQGGGARSLLFCSLSLEAFEL